MKKYKAGFAGAGHMGKILADAAVKTGKPVAVSCSTREHAEAAAGQLGCACADNREILSESEFVFLGMRPADLAAFTSENREELEKAEGVFVSMLAGTSLARLKKMLGEGRKIIRIMPNTPCAVGKGLIFCTADESLTEENKKELEQLLGSCGKLEWIPENDMDAVSVLGGCGPAYIYAYADALAKAGEAMGLTGKAAVRYAALTMLGSAVMMLESGRTPEELKNEVCSPGGTTIEGVRVLEAGNLSGLTGEALQASYRKTKGI